MFDNISNEELGARVKAAHIKHLERVEQQTPLWKITGKQFKNVRQSLNITQKQISNCVGISSQVIAKFEKGEPVRSRNMLEQSYKTALEFIQFKRSAAINAELGGSLQ